MEQDLCSNNKYKMKTELEVHYDADLSIPTFFFFFMSVLTCQLRYIHIAIECLKGICQLEVDEQSSASTDLFCCPSHH